jgi:hypothetical protein
MLCEWRIMYSVELQGLDKTWKEVEEDDSRWCKELLGLPWYVGNCMAEIESETNSRWGSRCGGQQHFHSD